MQRSFFSKKCGLTEMVVQRAILDLRCRCEDVGSKNTHCLDDGYFLLDSYKAQPCGFIRNCTDRIVAVVPGDRTSSFTRSLSADRYLAETHIFVADVILCGFLFGAAIGVSVTFLSWLLACTVLLLGATTSSRSVRARIISNVLLY